ncbi:MAG: hypothetical protein ACREER_13905 [Alphaproteobacteria bacterium]
MPMRLVGFLAAVMMLAWPNAAPAQTDPVIDAIFDEIEKRAIQEYYEHVRAAGLPLDQDDDQDQGQGQGKSKSKGQGQGLKKGWVQGIPPGHLPPPGLCRAWLPDTPPGHQPAPAPCGEVMASLPPGARLIYGGAKGKDDALPPGLGTVLPPDLIDTLPLPLPGTERLLVDDDVFLVRLGTRVILDVIEGVLLQQ